MRIALLDGTLGASGDMIMGALLDCGASPAAVRQAWRHAGLASARLRLSEVRRGGIRALRAQVQVGAKARRGRPAGEILRRLGASRLPREIREDARRVLERLARAEGHLHGSPPSTVILHELGGEDAIADVVGAVAALRSLRVERLYVTALGQGGGIVSSHEGSLPLPAPATLELLRGFEAHWSGRRGELTTPTAAAIASTLGRPAPPGLQFTLERVGYGAGARDDPDLPNIVRVWIGEEAAGGTDLHCLEAAIDDMSPELYGNLRDRLEEAGALEVLFLPAQMKKGRPGTLVRGLVEGALLERVLRALLLESTTAGARFWPAQRVALAREEGTVRTRMGTLRVKRVRLPDGTVRVKPEYDDLVRGARRAGLPLPAFRERILREISTLSKGGRDQWEREVESGRGKRGARRRTARRGRP